MSNNNEFYCLGCQRKHKKSAFYVSYNPIHNGIMPLCKSFIKKEVIKKDKSIDLEKLKSLLMQMDAPFLADYWQKAVEDEKETIGMYFKNLSLRQNRGLAWKDSTNETICTTENIVEGDNTNLEDDSAMTYSKEWRGKYNKSDLEYLDEYYRELNNDFKIATKNHKDYARKIAKASLAMDKAYEDMINGVNGADRRYKDLKDTFDTLSKSAQFSENTRGQNDVSLGCFGVLFDKVEQRQWIPKHTPIKKDDYDELIEHFTSINKSV